MFGIDLLIFCIKTQNLLFFRISSDIKSKSSNGFRSELMVKKLRYYARFIVVCLLLRRMKLVRELVVELDRHIADYTSTYEPDDQIEWSLVLDEIKSFITADSLVSVMHADTNPIVLSHRYIY